MLKNQTKQKFLWDFKFVRFIFKYSFLFEYTPFIRTFVWEYHK